VLRENITIIVNFPGVLPLFQGESRKEKYQTECWREIFRSQRHETVDAVGQHGDQGTIYGGERVSPPP
jgi:hypothetical protein